MAIWFYFCIARFDNFWSCCITRRLPLEPFVLFMSFLNPIDLARVALTLQMDLSSLLGAERAMIKHYFSGNLGVLLCSVVLFLWVFVPVLMGARLFKKKRSVVPSTPSTEPKNGISDSAGNFELYLDFGWAKCKR